MKCHLKDMHAASIIYYDACEIKCGASTTSHLLESSVSEMFHVELDLILSFYSNEAPSCI